MLAPVEVTGEVSLKLLHHAADPSSAGLDGNLVSVVRSKAVVQERYFELLSGLPESFAILVAVTSKAKEKGPIVTPVGQMTNHPWLHESIGSWHMWSSGLMWIDKASALSNVYSPDLSEKTCRVETGNDV
jgi:hypothetical protein